MKNNIFCFALGAALMCAGMAFYQNTYMLPKTNAQEIARLEAEVEIMETILMASTKTTTWFVSTLVEKKGLLAALKSK